MDGGEVEVPSSVPPIITVMYLAKAHEGPMNWDADPDPLRIPCPVELVYLRDTGPVLSVPRYRFHR